MKHRTSARWLALLGLLLVACPKNESREPVVVDARIPDAGPAASVTTPPPAKAAELPAPFSRIGGACGVEDTGGSVSEICDTSGRVVGIFAMVDTVRDAPPQDAEVIREEPRREMTPGRSLVVSIQGDHLWFRLVSCGACRRIMGWVFAGRLSKLSDAQLRDVQKRIGLPDDVPPLHTPDAWRKAYENRPPPPLPDGAIPWGKPHDAPPGIPGECINANPAAPVPPQCQNLK
jgi:hypothetical protein